MNRCKIAICNVDVHRASYANYLRNKKHLKIEKQNEMIIPDWFFQEHNENKPRKILNPKPLREIAKDIIKTDDKQLNEELAKNMIDPFYFTDSALKAGFDINLDSHHIDHAISNLTIIPNFPEFEIDLLYIN